MTSGNSTAPSATATNSGIGFLGLLTIVLLILKATGYLNISWLMVFLPVIIGFGILLLFILVFVVTFIAVNR